MSKENRPVASSVLCAIAAEHYMKSQYPPDLSRSIYVGTCAMSSEIEEWFEATCPPYHGASPKEEAADLRASTTSAELPRRSISLSTRLMLPWLTWPKLAGR